MKLDSISKRDQITRRNNYQKDINSDSLQLHYDSINRIELYLHADDILNNYYSIYSMYDVNNKVSSLPTYIDHQSLSDNLYFLEKMISFAKRKKCDWSLPLQTVVFLAFDFPYKWGETCKHNYLRFFCMDSNGDINEKKSYLQLIAMHTFLKDNNFINIELLAYDSQIKNNSISNLNWIKNFWRCIKCKAVKKTTRTKT